MNTLQEVLSRVIVPVAAEFPSVVFVQPVTLLMRTSAWKLEVYATSRKVFIADSDRYDDDEDDGMGLGGVSFPLPESLEQWRALLFAFGFTSTY